MSESSFNPLITTPEPIFNLGQRLQNDRGKEYIYVKFDYRFLATDRNVTRITHDYLAKRSVSSSSDTGNLIGVVEPVAEIGDYGWACVYGVTQIAVRLNCAAHVSLYTASSSNAARLDDASGGNRLRIHRAYLTTARGSSSGTAPGVLNYPFVRR